MATTEKLYFTKSGTSHNLSMGIVGLPNVGKSTLFNALTHQQVPAKNHTFCTIEPNEGRLLIKDERLDRLKELYNPGNVEPSQLLVKDIAGLVEGANEGHGLGNEFLDHINTTDGIFHVVRCFSDTNVPHFQSTVNSLRDIKTINNELRYRDISSTKKEIERHNKASRANAQEKSAIFKSKTLEKVLTKLETGWLKEEDFSNEEIQMINSFKLLTTKKVVILANIDEEEYKNNVINKHLNNIMRYGQAKDIPVVQFCAKHEFMMGKEGIYTPFVEKIVKEGYKCLNLINFFTAGKKEVKSWTIRRNTIVKKAGSVIHTEFEDCFINAQVMSFDDLNVFGSEVEVKKQGKCYNKGKTYVVEDGDIILFKLSPSKNAKKK